MGEGGGTKRKNNYAENVVLGSVAQMLNQVQSSSVVMGSHGSFIRFHDSEIFNSQDFFLVSSFCRVWLK